ncbi:unnamed protein product [Allacma fusca]|uniref:Uncharacterized protein n=1 Tax=Allacma fusca TaxID=39272 RepID=A0A8J2JZV0_9HEXA|nr:unnamed protein product [Allacma fusca]
MELAKMDAELEKIIEEEDREREQNLGSDEDEAMIFTKLKETDCATRKMDLFANMEAKDRWENFSDSKSVPLLKTSSSNPFEAPSHQGKFQSQWNKEDELSLNLFDETPNPNIKIAPVPKPRSVSTILGKASLTSNYLNNLSDRMKLLLSPEVKLDERPKLLQIPAIKHDHPILHAPTEPEVIPDRSTKIPHEYRSDPLIAEPISRQENPKDSNQGQATKLG